MKMEAIEISGQQIANQARGKAELARSEHGTAMNAARGEAASVQFAVKIGQREDRGFAAK